MDYPSLKKEICLALSFACSNAEAFKGNKPIFITAAGTITGDVIVEKFKDDTDERTYLPHEFVERFVQLIADGYFDKHNLEFPTKGNDGYLMLQNATIRNHSGEISHNLSNIVIFFDQIIGVTIGSYN